MTKSCENCRWTPDFIEAMGIDCTKCGICKYPDKLKYIGNPWIFIENKFSSGMCTTTSDYDGTILYNSSLPCPKWADKANDMPDPPLVEREIL